MLRRREMRALVVLVGITVSVVFGYLAVRGVKVGAARRALEASNAWWLVPSLAALAACVASRVVRWRLLFQPKRRPPYVPLAKATLIGLFFNSILPARAGEAARVVALKSYAGTPLAETAATVVVERVADVTSLLLLLFVLVPWLPHVSWLAAAVAVAGACLAAIILLAFVVWRLRFRPLPRMRLLARVPGLNEERAQQIAENALHGMATLTNPRQALAVLGWTYGSWLLLGLSFWFLMAGLHLHLSLLAALLVVIATGLSFIVPAAPAGVGVYEAAGLTALSAYGVDRSQAFAYVLVVHLVNFVPYVVLGLLLLVGAARGRRAAGPTAIARIRSGP
jgi:glycosyltransferase 2 family protein